MPGTNPSRRPSGPPQDAASSRPSGPPQEEGRDRPAPGLILVGRFGAPQGVRGQVRVQSFTADPLAIATYGDLSDRSGARVFRVVAVQPLKGAMLVATVAGVTDRDTAAALTGLEVYARREALPPPDDDEVYVVDLVGIIATDIAGVPVGTIVNVLNHGAGDILEIAPTEGGETSLVPFTRAFVPEVDVAGKRVVVVVPADGDNDGDGC